MLKPLKTPEKISEKFGIPLGDLVDVFAEIPAADVVPRAELAREIFEEIEYLIWQNDTHPASQLTEDIADLKKKYAADEEIIPLF